MCAMSRVSFRPAIQHRWLVLVLVSVLAGAGHIAGRPGVAGAQAGRLPNVVLILADDLGFGDVGSFNASGKVPTPHIDRLAREGVRFVDAHTNSAVCSPTRYGLMTGRYAWRTRLTSGVLWGESEPLIEPGRTTLASLLRGRGYHTAGIGKWHLGLGWAALPGATPSTATQNEVEWIDYAKPVAGGPLTAGFDSFFGIPASLDMPPYLYLVDDRVERAPTARLPGVPSSDPGFYRPGIAAPGFRVEAVLGDLTARAVAQVRARARERDRPFFLYLALSAPHTPVVPTPAFAGRSGIGRYGDFVAETDAAVGAVVRAIDEAGLSRDTLVIVTSDNGPAPAGGIAEALSHGHDASGGFRGAKADLFEGGHRVPFVARWPGVVPAGTTSSRLIATTDIFATIAEIVGVPLRGGEGEDSFSFAAALRDPERAPSRDAGFVMHSVHGAFAIRQGRFKLLLAPGSGGWSDPKPGSPEEKGLPATQLYDLEADPKESSNLVGAQPEIAARLERLLGSYRDTGRSAPARQPARTAAADARSRPNILLAIADDWSFPHAGAYGDRTVRTPNFDRIAREGVRFAHAFVAAPSCTPSRAALLTGQAVHRLEEGGNLHGFLPQSYPVYPDLLEEAGYVVGYSGKGWGPGRFEAGGRSRNPAGPAFKSFDEFMEKREPGRPFCFWFGSQDPHRPYDPGTGAQSGMKAEGVRVPRFVPDTAEVRQDILDYYFEVQRFDRDLGHVVELLERAGELDDTIVIVTSDNGMPFPRAKATVYDGGVRVPLAIRWPGVARAGQQIEALVSLTDLAPTVLESAGLKPLEVMTGRSLLPLLRGQPQEGRDRVFVERERHANVRRGDLSYPVRAIRTKDYLYIRNFRPDRWPAGDPELHVAVGPFGDIDGGPTKSVLLDRRQDPAIAAYFRLATAKRPAEELYDLKTDPEQLENVAGRAPYRDAQLRLRAELDAWLRETGDPRMAGDDDRWDRFPYYGQPAK
jgi:N-sulfoglucosamine sulfohydrolase